MLYKRMNAKAVIGAIMKSANGIGVSKSGMKSNSDLKGANGHFKSRLSHSIKSTQNLRTVTTQYIEHLKEQYGQRITGNINKETAREWLLSKLEQGVNGGTLNTYISALAKVFDNVEKLGVNVSSGVINELRKEFKDDGIDLSKNHYNRAYENPHKIINNMRNNSDYAISAELQLNAGLRLDDAINSNKWQINDDNTITIIGSKNGLNYKTRELHTQLIKRAIEAKKSGYKAPKTNYTKDLKKAGADERGTHGLRYNFAQERYAELRNKLGHIGAMAQTAIEMGHSRTEITAHYL